MSPGGKGAVALPREISVAGVPGVNMGTWMDSLPYTKAEPDWSGLEDNAPLKGTPNQFNPNKSKQIKLKE